jgi:hypothetical protein
MTEFKGRIIECLNLQVLCVSEYFDYYEEYFPNNEMLVYKDDAELAIILEKLQNKDYYDRALKKFLSVLDSKSTSIFVSYLNNFDMQLFTVVSNPPKACYKLKLNLSGKIYSKIDMITIRGYRLLKKYSKLLSVR